MDRFSKDFQVIVLDNHQHETVENFYYIDPDHGLVTVPSGFRTDFASVKSLRNWGAALMGIGITFGLWLNLLHLVLALGVVLTLLYASVVGYGVKAAVIHDFLYSGSNIVSRKKADKIFFNALRSSGHSRWRAWLMWIGVRLGGSTSFKS